MQTRVVATILIVEFINIDHRIYDMPLELLLNNILQNIFIVEGINATRFGGCHFVLDS